MIEGLAINGKVLSAGGGSSSADIEEIKEMIGDISAILETLTTVPGTTQWIEERLDKVVSVEVDE